jgi:phage repressor protein C with HTH and peptisase S24 domain
LGQRIKELRGKQSQGDFADLVGLNINTLRGYEKGHRMPGADTISIICQITGATTTWLLKGEGPVYTHENARLATAALGPLDAARSTTSPERLRHLRLDSPATGRIQSPTAEIIDGLIMVPKVAARLSAGGGSFEASAEIKGRYAFREDWLRAKGSPEDMVLMEVSGDSMEPELRDGDTVLINQGQVDVLAGKVFAVGIEDTVVVKQLERRPGALVLRSTNPAYAPMEIDMRGDLADTVRIIGRVIWWCHEAR